MSYDYEREEASATSKLTYLLIGGGIGAVLALLFAPKSGQELREDITVATKKGIEKGKETAGQLQEAAGDYYEVTREKASELYQTAQDKAGELGEKASGLGEKAKSAAAQTANPFSAAIEAGKEAYQDEKRKLDTESEAIIDKRPEYPVTEGKVLEIPEINNNKENKG